MELDRLDVQGTQWVAVLKTMLKVLFCPTDMELVLLQYPNPTPKPRFLQKTVHRRNLGFFRHN